MRRGGGRRDQRRNRGKGQGRGTEDLDQGRTICLENTPAENPKIQGPSLQVKVEAVEILREVAQQAVQVSFQGEEVAVEGKEKVQRKARKVQVQIKNAITKKIVSAGASPVCSRHFVTLVADFGP